MCVNHCVTIGGALEFIRYWLGAAILTGGAISSTGARGSNLQDPTSLFMCCVVFEVAAGCWCVRSPVQPWNICSASLTLDPAVGWPGSEVDSRRHRWQPRRTSVQDHYQCRLNKPMSDEVCFRESLV